MKFAQLVLIILTYYSLSLGEVFAQFTLNGDAIITNDSCYQLTEEFNFSAGSIWNEQQINLHQSFDVVLTLYLGKKDVDGADGLVFGFQPVSTAVGEAGAGIGFRGIEPSLGIELDTWQNVSLGDLEADHIAIFRDGNLSHNSTSQLAGPIQAGNSANIEDDRFHDFRLNWDATDQVLKVYFDCRLRLTYTGDIVEEIFRGDPWVYWGLTAATGGANNIHQVCFTFTTFLDELDDVVVCPGSRVQLQTNGGVQYDWSPGTGLSDSTSAAPWASPDTTTNYRVAIIDVCGRPIYDEVKVSVAGDSSFFDLGNDTLLCTGEEILLDANSSNSIYAWSTGETSSTITVQDSGTYKVTVTKTDTFCMAEDHIRISEISYPEVSLPRDTALCFDQTIYLYAGNSMGERLWSDGTTGDSLYIDRGGIYRIGIENDCGLAQASIEVEYEDCHQIYFPGAFSPNNDGVNDVFYGMDGGDVVMINELRIYERWGGLIFENKELLPNMADLGWDGTVRGEPMDTGLYIWTAEVCFRDGQCEILRGEVLLIRE